jgi:hypothetical protein
MSSNNIVQRVKISPTLGFPNIEKHSRDQIYLEIGEKGCSDDFQGYFEYGSYGVKN